MHTHSKGTLPLHSALIAQAIASALVVMLIIALVLFMWLAPMRSAYGGIEVFAEAAAIVAPVTAEGIAAIVAAVLTGAATVWLYVRELAH
jgi:hypothetical protein